MRVCVSPSPRFPIHASTLPKRRSIRGDRGRYEGFVGGWSGPSPPEHQGLLVEGTGDGFKRGGEKVVKVIKDDSTGEMLKGGWMKGSCLARSRMGAG